MSTRWPTEEAATLAVDAAAKAAYDDNIKARKEVFPPSATFPEWDDLHPTEKLQIRESVLPLVWAALAALPDPRYTAWEAGMIASYEDRDSPNPYPSPFK